MAECQKDKYSMLIFDMQIYLLHTLGKKNVNIMYAAWIKDISLEKSRNANILASHLSVIPSHLCLSVISRKNMSLLEKKKTFQVGMILDLQKITKIVEFPYMVHVVPLGVNMLCNYGTSVKMLTLVHYHYLNYRRFLDFTSLSTNVLILFQDRSQDPHGT